MKSGAARRSVRSFVTLSSKGQSRYHVYMTTHRVWAVVLIGIGFAVVVSARRISTLKSSAWARFYKRHPAAAETNPLSKHSGTERSIRLGAMMWRIVGAAIVLNGLLRL